MKLPCRFLLLVLCSLLSTATATIAQQYVWTNFAGTAGGLGHAVGTGTNARFVYPAGVATDGSGNLYVADTANQIIRKITPAGVTTTFAGTAGVSGTANGIGSAALFNSPSALAIDGSGAVYVADTASNTIRRVSPAGVVTTPAGSPGVSGTANGLGAAARFNAPAGITLAGASSKFYIADTGNNTIRTLTAAGAVTTLAGIPAVSGSADGGANVALFNQPIGVGVDSSGSVYVADSANETIRCITLAGTASVSTIA